ncbi:hypothetical protein HDC92_001398 [Pedobacter sp. AK017]|uniref:DUF6520 family protein n=1 Tax=Pedobacter sp. AK017 TaxID=2723073 RepID=UPI001622C3DD|nr:DUF6520 family protein [Pedobacter sp. AK017]MBB5437724.1 hypothetical protein [Pedobacter sp. AK017]
MKKIFLSALVATVAIGGAFLSQGEAKASGKVTRTPGIYYLPSNQCATVDCTGSGTDCDILFPDLPDTRTVTEGSYDCDFPVQPIVGQLN